MDHERMSLAIIQISDANSTLFLLRMKRFADGHTCDQSISETRSIEKEHRQRQRSTALAWNMIKSGLCECRGKKVR